MKHSDFAPVDAVKLRAYLPHLRAGAQALRERERWAGRAFLVTDADHAAQDARALEEFARWVDRACPEGEL